MNRNLESLNNILTEWNPIGVPKSIAIEEYKSYIPLIIQSIGNQQELMSCLEDILINKLELGYDPKNRDHVEELKKVCNSLILAYKV